MCSTNLVLKVGINNKMRAKYKDISFYDYTIEFCDNYDSSYFDPQYENEGISFFSPIFRRAFV